MLILFSTHFRPAAPDYPRISTNIQTATESVVHQREQTPNRPQRPMTRTQVEDRRQKNIKRRSNVHLGSCGDREHCDHGGRRETLISHRPAKWAEAQGLLFPAALLLWRCSSSVPIAYSVYGSLTNAALSRLQSGKSNLLASKTMPELLTSNAFWKAVTLTVIFVFASAVVGENV